MSEQNKTLRHSDASGKLYKVPVPVLHNASTDHAGIPGPFNKHISDNYILHADTQQTYHGKHHDLAGEREHHIHHSHDDFFYHAPEISGHNAQERPQADGPQHGQQCQAQSGSDAVDQPGQDAPPQMIGSKRILQAIFSKLI